MWCFIRKSTVFEKSLGLLCAYPKGDETNQHLCRHNTYGKLKEGVGFEPTVGFPTFDFKSKALSRTQPSFHV